MLPVDDRVVEGCEGFEHGHGNYRHSVGLFGIKDSCLDTAV